ncbi:MAG: hypothetical protein J6W00_10235 [Lentisphaeria bacterium]|nr:hypothetical protein [Lentisphaeria bacterium]
MAHYTKEELDLYRTGKLSLLGRINCAAHLKSCPECTKLLEELEQDDKLLKELKESCQLFQELSCQYQHRSSVES